MIMIIIVSTMVAITKVITKVNRIILILIIMMVI